MVNLTIRHSCLGSFNKENIMPVKRLSRYLSLPCAPSFVTHSAKRTYSTPVLVSYWLGPAFIISCHIGVLLALFTGLSFGAWMLVAVLYWIRMLAITGIYHRLLTHRAYRAPAAIKWIGSLVATTAGQMGPSWWKGHHNDHHLYSDQRHDPHNSTLGFWWSHQQWLLSPNFLPSRLPADIEQDPVLKAIDRLHFLPPLLLAIATYAFGGLEYLAAFFVSTTLLFHGVATVNSLCHKFGNQPFISNDNSRNNALVAFLTLGEGWHNCHHAFPWSARQGITLMHSSSSPAQVKYLPDPTYRFIKVLQRLGLASQLKHPTQKEMLPAATVVAKQ